MTNNNLYSHFPFQLKAAYSHTLNENVFLL